MEFIKEGIDYKQKHINQLERNEAEYKLILPIYERLCSKHGRTLEDSMTLRGCEVRLQEIVVQTNAINQEEPIKKKPTIIPSNSKLKCVTEPMGFNNSNGNIIIRAKFTKGKTQKMIIVLEVHINDIIDGSCKVKQKEKPKGNTIFNLDECKLLLDNTLSEYDWVLTEKIKITL